MTEPVRVSFESLPAEATKGIEQFSFAYHLPASGRFVIRHVNPTTKTVQEVEFDIASNRVLSNAERSSQLPPPRQTVLVDARRNEVLATYYLRSPGQELWMHLEVYDLLQGQKIGEVDRPVYSPLTGSISRAASDAVKKAEFPAQYAAWDDDGKIGYWAAYIHRGRRSSGESGGEEDAVFEPKLLQRMEALDPSVRLLLPRILELAARLGQVDVALLKRSFETRVGIVV